MNFTESADVVEDVEHALAIEEAVHISGTMVKSDGVIAGARRGFVPAAKCA